MGESKTPIWLGDEFLSLKVHLRGICNSLCQLCAFDEHKRQAAKMMMRKTRILTRRRA